MRFNVAAKRVAKRR